MTISFFVYLQSQLFVLLSRPVFRSYQPTNEELEGTVLPEGRTGEVVDHVQEELANDKEGVVVNELDFMNLAPRKPGIERI